jgi:C1A family cysteine protease
MTRFIYVLFIFCASCQTYAQTYRTGENWVTRYLKAGGDIKNVTGLEQPANWRDGATFDDMHGKLVGLPNHFNWNDYFKLQPIKNQASCGSCWSFAITAVVESLYFIRNGTANNDWFDLAEQTLVSSCETGGSCQGGYFTALNYVRDNGLPHETSDPYLARNSQCKSGLESVQKVVEWKYIGGGNTKPTTEQLKAAIYHFGPIAVDVNGGFNAYSSGVYTGCGSTGTNHMVTIEGWTDDSQYDQNGGGFWHMRNSWGESWGENGFMRIVYKSTRGQNCNGIGNVGAYAIIEELEPRLSHKQKVSPIE